MSNSFSGSTPQFGTAEYVGPPESDRCQYCQQPIAGNYYRVNGAIACSSCAETSRTELAKDSHATYTRALLYGIGAAVAGMVLYATFEIATGIIIGYVSLAVGWMVAKAMMQGSKGVGGPRYQVAAALLTYAAVSLAAVPVIIHYARGHQRHAQVQQQNLDEEQRQLEAESGQSHSQGLRPQNQQTANQRPPNQQLPKMSAGAAIGKLALFGLASPFLEVMGNPFGGLIGLVILFVGIRIAVRITAGRPAEVFGPFDSGVQAPR
jgi:hypothetical protein